MQGNARGLIRVTREAVVTNERQTDFQGVRKIMVEHAVRVIVPFEGVVQPEWRYEENSGQYLYSAVAFIRNRANPAFTRGGVL